jgi:hypothetical protein
MAIDLTLKSTAIIRTVYGYLASVTASLSATSVIRLVEVPSNAIVHSVKISSGAQTAGKFDIGVYRNNADGGAAVDQDFFTTDLDCASAVIDQECVMKATSVNTIAKRNQPLWQAIGMTSDPKTTLDICATVHTTDVTTGTGALGGLVQYTL